MNRKTLQNFPARGGYKYAFTSSGNFKPDPTPASEIISTLREEVTKSYPFLAKIVTWGHFAPKDSFYVISLCAVEHFHQNGQLRGKVRRVDSPVATKNVTISALVALFNIHNAQTCWLRGQKRDTKGEVINPATIAAGRDKALLPRTALWPLPFGTVSCLHELCVRAFFVGGFVISYRVCDLPNSTNVQCGFAETFQLRKRSFYSSAQTYVSERPRSQHVWALWMLKSATITLIVTGILRSHSVSQLAELYLAVVHFVRSVRLHTKKLRKNCPLARNALTWRFWREMGMILSPPPVEGR